MVKNNNGRLSLTKFGEAMAKYCLKLGTMQLILKMAPKATMSNIVRAYGNFLLVGTTRLMVVQLTVISQAEEFKDLRLRSGEKGLYKDLNKDNGVKYPIKEDIGTAAHKVCLIIQVGLI
jgi:ATP-dependent DNA helicase HFM1/MER3